METSHQTYTLEAITQRKEQLREEIRQQQQQMKATAKELFAPVRPAGKAASIMQSINSGLALFDGAMLGWKIVRRIRRSLR